LFSYYGEIWLESQEGIGSAFIFVAACRKKKRKKSQTNRIQKHEKEIVPKRKKIKKC
jgi:hypothetical protein